MIITSNAVLMMRQVKLSDFTDEDEDEDVLVECNRSSSLCTRRLQCQKFFGVGTAGSASLAMML